MNKNLKIISVLVALCMCIGLTACGDKSNKTILKVSVYSAGFGREWLDTIAEKYEKNNPNIRVKISATVGMESTAQGALESGKASALSDIYSCISYGNFYDNVNNSRLLDLNDLYSEKNDNGKTLSEMIDPAVEDMVKRNGTYYGVPWNASVTSIIYNINMFEQYNWQVPTTFDEYFALCDTISETTNVYPLGYVGGVGCDGYFKNVLSALAFQYGGEAAYKEYYSFKSADVYRQEGRKKAYETIGKMIAGKGVDSQGATKSWVFPGSNTGDNIKIEKAFLDGNCAMIVCGSWLMTEMKDYLVKYPNFKCAMMPMPWINNEKISLDKGTKNANQSDCTLFVVPANAKNKNEAKDFLKFMNSDEMLKLYTEKTNNIRPFTYDGVDMNGFDEWTTSIINIYKNSLNIYGISDNIDFINGRLKPVLANDYKIISKFIDAPMDNISFLAQQMIDDDYKFAHAILGK